MGIVRFRTAISLDGYTAGPRQRLEHPLGEGGTQLHEWAFATRWFHELTGQEGGTTGIDDERGRAGLQGVGATVMGRNMFGPVRGPWTEPLWNGWWGEEPPFHHPVFVLTHEAREPLELRGTTFHFVTEGFTAALERARAAAGDLDVAIGGGASTVRQALRAGVVDAFELHVVPVLLGAGERLFDGLEPGKLGFACTGVDRSPAVAHVRFGRV